MRRHRRRQSPAQPPAAREQRARAHARGAAAVRLDRAHHSPAAVVAGGDAHHATHAAGTAVVIEVPLLAGESVTRPACAWSTARCSEPRRPHPGDGLGVDAGGGFADRLAGRDDTAGARGGVDASPIWHVDATGIPAVHQPASGATRLREWRPCRVRRSRSSNAPGGHWRTNAHHRRSVVKSARHPRHRRDDDHRHPQQSRAQHTVTLPDGAQLQSVSVNDQDHRSGRWPQRDAPTYGRQTVGVSWRLSEGIHAASSRRRSTSAHRTST